MYIGTRPRSPRRAAGPCRRRWWRCWRTWRRAAGRPTPTCRYVRLSDACSITVTIVRCLLGLDNRRHPPSLSVPPPSTGLDQGRARAGGAAGGGRGRVGAGGAEPPSLWCAGADGQGQRRAHHRGIYMCVYTHKDEQEVSRHFSINGSHIPFLIPLLNKNTRRTTCGGPCGSARPPTPPTPPPTRSRRPRGASPSRSVQEQTRSRREAKRDHRPCANHCPTPCLPACVCLPAGAGRQGAAVGGGALRPGRLQALPLRARALLLPALPGGRRARRQGPSVRLPVRRFACLRRLSPLNHTATTTYQQSRSTWRRCT